MHVAQVLLGKRTGEDEKVGVLGRNAVRLP